MRIDRVVIDDSPLITLFRSGQANLLPALFDHIVVPDVVWSEVVAERDDAAAVGLPAQPWSICQPAPPVPEVTLWNLGRGETTVLSHALRHPSTRAIIDDREARRRAQTLGIPVLGTGGLLVLAKCRQLIPSLSDALTRIRRAGLYLSGDVTALLRQLAGE